MKTVIFLFDKEAYKEGLNLESRFNIFKWTYDMCNKEVNEVDDFNLVMKLDMSDEDDLLAYEDDFNEGMTLNGQKYIMRAFIVPDNKE